MTILNKFVRPIETFEASNKKHREYYSQYMATNSWGDCPFQLRSGDASLSLVGYAREELIKFYMNKEFPNGQV